MYSFHGRSASFSGASGAGGQAGEENFELAAQLPGHRSKLMATESIANNLVVAAAAAAVDQSAIDDAADDEAVNVKSNGKTNLVCR